MNKVCRQETNGIAFERKNTLLTLTFRVHVPSHSLTQIEFLIGEETWDDWDEETEESMAKCLFCDAKDFPKQVLQHVAKDHGLDYFQLRKDLGEFFT